MDFEKFDHVLRPLVGRDIDEWRTANGLSMRNAVHCLGIADYKNKLLSQKPLEYSLELLIRLYYENPGPGVWPQKRLSIAWLFEQMYGDLLEKFIGTEHEVTARVDLQARFAKLFGRSKGRAYRWLDPKETNASISDKTQETIQEILSKLSQLKNPGATLERLGSFVWALRGEDINTEFPIPSLRHPPRRERRGRRPGSRITADGAIRRVISPEKNIKIKDSSVLGVALPVKKLRRSAVVKVVKKGGKNV